MNIERDLCSALIESIKDRNYYSDIIENHASKAKASWEVEHKKEPMSHRACADFDAYLAAIEFKGRVRG